MHEKGLLTRTHSARDQVPDCPDFTCAKNKLSSWDKYFRHRHKGQKPTIFYYHPNLTNESLACCLKSCIRWITIWSPMLAISALAVHDLLSCYIYVALYLDLTFLWCVVYCGYTIPRNCLTQMRPYALEVKKLISGSQKNVWLFFLHKWTPQVSMGRSISLTELFDPSR